MEVYFLDIGRGTSNAILLGNSRAIVIDCGQNSDILLQLLATLKIQEIAVLALSHNDDDHVGGALKVLTAYERRIDRICFLDDGRVISRRFWTKIRQQIQDQTISQNQLVRIEATDAPKVLHDQKEPAELSLSAWSPRFGENLQAIGSRSPNATSGVLVLQVGGGRVVFAGDSTISQWRTIRQGREHPLQCDILAVPHHGGIVWSDREEIGWLYTEGVRPRHAIISAATSNTDRHPRPEVIQELISAGATVICTQITQQCRDSLEPVRPGVLRPEHPGRSSSTPDYTKSGRSRNVACGGTMVAEFARYRFVLHRLDEHRAGVDRLARESEGHPLCRSPDSSTTIARL